MRRMPKNKKNKVPKITEEEYARYISALRNEAGKTESTTQADGKVKNNNNEI